MKKSLFLFVGFSFLFSIATSYAQEAESYSLAPAPDWIESYPTPSLDSLPDEKPPLYLIHQEYQYNQMTGERYFRNFYYFHKARGLSQLEYINNSYRPKFQHFILHTVNTYRAGDTLDILSKIPIAFVNSKTKIGLDAYDEESQVILSLPGMEVGDVLEVAYTIRGKQPDIHNRLQLLFGPKVSLLRGTAYYHIRNYPDRPIYIESVNVDPAITEIQQENYRAISFQLTMDSAYKKPRMPRVYYTVPKFFVYDLESWAEKITYDMKNYQFAQEPSEEVQAMTQSLIADSMSQEEKIQAIFSYTQDEIEYMSYGMVQPYRPETVIQQNYGDCKSTSLLTIKMLETIGVEAWPVEVVSDGWDPRLLEVYGLGLVTDHIIVEYVLEGDTIIFDPTAKPLRKGIKQTYRNNYRYGIRLLPETITWSELSPYRSPYKELVVNITPEDVKTNVSDVNWTIKTKDYGADELIIRFQEGNTSRVFDYYKDNLTSYNYISSSDFELDFEYDSTASTAQLDVETKELSNYLLRTKSDSMKLVPWSIRKRLSIVDSSRLGYIFALPTVGEVHHIYKLYYPKDLGYQPKDFSIEKDWINCKQEVWLEGDTLYLSIDLIIKEQVLPSEKYGEASQIISQLKSDLGVVVGEAPKIKRKRKKRRKR
ncbi:MAG: DUF3857 domain-containing protein [Bacteroidota bacterium]